MYFLITAAVGLVSAAVLYPRVIKRLKKAGMTGTDVNKPDRPEVAEMGGLVIAASFAGGILTAIALDNFLGPWKVVDTRLLMAALASVLVVALIGIFDDILHVRKPFKMVAPFLAALPLAAVKAGVTFVKLPLLGEIEFGALYPLVVVPIGMTGAANAANILGGFNGLEAGLGLIASTALAVITYTREQYTAFVLLVCVATPLCVTLYFNWYPARVFVGDVGTFTIGAVLCASAILGNCETAGVLVMIPYGIDFVFKAWHRLPSKDWWGIFWEGKLYCPPHGPVGLAQFVLKITGGLSEVRLVLVLLGVELFFAGAAVALYGSF